ncbi:proteinase-activated receptor 1-like [Rhinoderma darwinii]|uniref:proteinase-activated receptor 1-like n=1 Tax=Rhinoderma darwinii TaxID=43563 RepID=UPI003F67928E
MAALVDTDLRKGLENSPASSRRDDNAGDAVIEFAKKTGKDGKTSTEISNTSSTKEGNSTTYPLTESSTIDPQEQAELLAILNLYRTDLSANVILYLSSRWLTIFAPVIYIFVFLIALPLNITAIIMFVVKTKVKKPAVVYMLNLAVADVLFLCTLPFNIVYRFSGNNWLIGEEMCRFTIAAFYCNLYCSILIMTAMSVDKYLAVVYPLQSLYWRKVSRSWWVCFTIWFISIGSTIPLLIHKQSHYFVSIDKTTCHDVQSKGDTENLYRYYYPTFCTFLFFLPLIVTTFCYSVTIRTLSSSKMGDTEKKRQAVILVIIVLCAFFLCFGPTNVILFIHSLRISSESSNYLYFIYMICMCVFSVSCCLDPLFYYIASTKINSYIYKMLCCRKNSEESQLTKSNSTNITSLG